MSTAPFSAGDEDDGKGVRGPFSRFALSNTGETPASLLLTVAKTTTLTSAAVFIPLPSLSATTGSSETFAASSPW